MNFNDSCKQITGNTYYAFADEVVYELKIFEKSKEKIPPFCTQKAKFNERSFTDYISVIQSEQDFLAKENVERGGNVLIKFEKVLGSFKYIKWLINDYKNLRWFEFTVSTYKEEKISDETQFVDSLKLTVDSSGTEIDDGSDVLLGDDLPKQNKLEDKNILNDKTENSPSSALNIIVKPKPKYTDLARKSNTVGNVRMRVTFLQNGAIGAVTPLNDLENGLTEQAIEARLGKWHFCRKDGTMSKSMLQKS